MCWGGRREREREMRKMAMSEEARVGVSDSGFWGLLAERGERKD